jgi:hypothetical protein
LKNKFEGVIFDIVNLKNKFEGVIFDIVKLYNFII